jgi:hypothetical protein
MSTNDFYTKRLNQLIGGKVTTSFIIEEGSEIFYGIDIKMPNGEIKYLVFLSDDEANGPGSFQIGDLPKKVDDIL